MPVRAAPGHQDRLEEALSPRLRAALEELRELLDVWDWQASALGPPFQQAAAILEAERLVRVEGLSEKDAIDAAAIRLGLSENTVRSRARRWPEDSRANALCTPTAETSGATMDSNTDETATRKTA